MNHKELIERLRYGSLCPVSGDGCEDKLKAADAIESLLAENERLKAELAKCRDAPVVAWKIAFKSANERNNVWKLSWTNPLTTE